MYPIQVTLTISDAQAHARLIDYIEGGKAEEPKAAAKPKPKAEEPKAEEPKAEPLTYDTVAAALTGFARSNGRDAAVELLAKFNAKKLPEVAEDDYAALLDAING